MIEAAIETALLILIFSSLQLVKVTELAGIAIIDKNLGRHRLDRYESPPIGAVLSRRKIERSHSRRQADAVWNSAAFN
jgi:hypothetical protein